MSFDVRRWSNNLAGVALISALFLVLVIALNRANPAAATGSLVWFFVFVGLVSVAGWIALSFRAGAATGLKLLRNDEA